MYVTGDTIINETTKYIITKKYDSLLNLKWKRFLVNPQGYDKGMDIVVEESTPFNVYVTGYYYDNSTKKNSIITIKYNGDNGDTIWSKKVDDYRESKGFGIALDEAQNIYVGGYITGEKNRKDFLAFRNGFNRKHNKLLHGLV